MGAPQGTQCQLTQVLSTIRQLTGQHAALVMQIVSVLRLCPQYTIPACMQVVLILVFLAQFRGGVTYSVKQLLADVHMFKWFAMCCQCPQAVVHTVHVACVKCVWHRQCPFYSPSKHFIRDPLNHADCAAVHS